MRKSLVVRAGSALFRNGSFFVCVSRGGLYETPSLVSALYSGNMAGTDLDVTNPQPLRVNHAEIISRFAHTWPLNYGRQAEGD
jgi:phosphoglycerate dehydrogenase-like enzyme